MVAKSLKSLSLVASQVILKSGYYNPSVYLAETLHGCIVQIIPLALSGKGGGEEKKKKKQKKETKKKKERKE